MLKNATLVFLVLCVLAGAYEFVLRDQDVFGGRKVLRIGAEGWQIHEFKLPRQAEEFARRHPDVRVELHQLPSGYETSLMLQASLKDLAYDVILSANNYSIDRYYIRGLLIDPTTLVGSEFERTVLPSMLRAGQVSTDRGRATYLLPYMGEVNVLNYRTDLLKEAGFDRPPETWEEFEHYAERLTDPARNLHGISLCVEQSGFFLQNTYLPLLRCLRGSAVDDQGRLDLRSPESRQVFRMVKRWWKKGYISPACKNTNGAAEDFKAGLTAIFPHWQSRGLWAITQNENLRGKIGFAPLPNSDKVGSLYCVYGGYVLKGSKVQAEAAQFLTEVMCGYAQKDIIAAGKMPVTFDSYQPGVVPDWMIQIRPTIDNGYIAPEPLIWADLGEFVSVAFHKYLASASDDPGPFLDEADDQISQRVAGIRK